MNIIFMNNSKLRQFNRFLAGFHLKQYLFLKIAMAAHFLLLEIKNNYC